MKKETYSLSTIGHYAAFLLQRREEYLSDININAFISSLKSNNSATREIPIDKFKELIFLILQSFTTININEIESRPFIGDIAQLKGVVGDGDDLMLLKVSKLFFLHSIPNYTLEAEEAIKIALGVEEVFEEIRNSIESVSHDSDWQEKSRHNIIEDYYSLKQQEKSLKRVIEELQESNQELSQIEYYQKLLYKELEEKNLFIEKITKTSPNGIYIFDLTEWHVVYYNRDLFFSVSKNDEGYAEKGPIKREKVYPSDYQRIIDFFNECKTLDENKSLKIEIKLKNEYDGYNTYLNTASVFQRKDDGTVAQVIGVLQDITDIKNTEAALQNSIEKLDHANAKLTQSDKKVREVNQVLTERNHFIQKVTDYSPVGIYIFDIDRFHMIFLNKCMKESIGYSAEQVNSFSDSRIHPDDVENRRNFYLSFREAGDKEVKKTEVRYIDINNRWHSFLITATPFKRDRNGNVVEIIGITQDITYIKLKENQLKEALKELQETYLALVNSEEKLKMLNEELEEKVNSRTEELLKISEKLQLISEISNEAVYDAMLPSSGAKMDKSFNEIFGLLSEDEEFTMESWQKRIHPDDVYYATQVKLNAFETKKEGCIIEYRFLKADETYAHVLERCKILYNESGTPYRITGSIMDISRLRKTEFDLAENKRVLDLALKASNMFVWTKNLKTGQVNASDSTLPLYSERTGQIITKFEDVPNYIHQEDFKKYLAIMGEAIKAKSSYLGQFRVLNFKSNEVFWFEDNGGVVLDKEGNVESIGGVTYEITQRKRDEEALLDLNQKLQIKNTEYLLAEEELRATNDDLNLTVKELDERNFELDQFVYRISHDLRAPLTSMMGLISLTKVSSSIEETTKYVDLIENRVFKLDNFIKSLLEYSRNSRVAIVPEAIDINSLLDESLEELSYLKSFNNINISFNIRQDRPFHSDKLRLKIAFNNIISNVVKYQDLNKSEQFLDITIRVSEHYGVFIFKDNGIGIKSDYLPRIFEMFFRASESSEGSGLGMYIVKQVIEKMGGTVKVKSDYGKKTVVGFKIKNFYTSSAI